MKIRISALTFLGIGVLLFAIHCNRDYSNPVDPNLAKAIPPTPRNLELFAVQGQAMVQGRFSYSYQNDASIVYERSLKGQNSFHPLDTLLGDTTFLDSLGLSYYTEYEYRLCGINSNGRSNYSLAASVRTFNEPTLSDHQPPALGDYRLNGIAFVRDSASVEFATATLTGKVSDSSGVTSIVVNDSVALKTDSLWSVTVRLVNDSFIPVCIRATDASINRNVFLDTLQVRCKADHTPPVVRILSHPDSAVVTADSIVLSGVVTDESGIFSMNAMGSQAVINDSIFTLTVRGLSQGAYLPIIIDVRDNSTAKNQWKDTLYIKYDPTLLDTIPPVITVNTLAGYDTVVTASLTVSGLAVDAASGVKSVTVNSIPANRNGSNWSFTENALFANQNNQIVIVAVDNSTRANTARETLFVYYRFDNHPPTLAVTVPSIESLYVTTQACSLRGTVSDPSGINLVTVNFNPADTGAGKWNYRYIFDAYDTWRKLEIIALDNSPQHNRDTLIRYLRWDSTYDDFTPPVIVITSQAMPDTVGQAVIALSGVARDYNGTRTVWVNGRVAALTLDSAWTLPDLAVTVPSTGRYASTSVQIIAEDRSFHKNRDTLNAVVVFDSALVSTMDYTAPFVSIKNGSSLTGVCDTFFADTFTLNGDVNDPSGVDSFGVRINNGTWIDLGKGSWSHLFTVDEFRNPFVFMACDFMGNHRLDTVVVLRDYPNVVHNIRFDIASGQISLSWNRYIEPDFRNLRIWAALDYYADTSSLTLFAPNIGADTFVLFIPPEPSKLYTFIIQIVDSLGQGSSLLKAVIRKGMVLIPSGTFQMGSSIEMPIHTVMVSSLYMDSTEVTQADYSAVTGRNPSFFKGLPQRPVENVSWYDAVLYCNARSKRDDLDTVYSYTAISDTAYAGCSGLTNLTVDTAKKGYRLPSEAEWEYACRAGTTTDTYWGSNPTADYAWYGEGDLGATHEVASKIKNGFSLYDICGNVDEWCNDWYGNYASTTQINPVGPISGTYRVLRGGDWRYGSGQTSVFRSYSFNVGYPDYRSYVIGFRPVSRP